jgi:PadR family transcriptional regulator PadR
MNFSRELLRGSLEMLVLSHLASGERYGYQLLSSLRDRSAGRIELKAGTLYPILHKLERAGCVRSRWDETAGRDRKWYALTAKGRAKFERDAREWVDYASCVKAMLRSVLGGEAARPEMDAGSI